MTFDELRRRVWFFLHRERVKRELEEEMRLHVQLRAEFIAKARMVNADNIHAIAAAHRQFGNFTSTQQRSYDMWGFVSVEEVMRDFRLALRRLKQQRGFSIGVIGVMAIGIGAVTAMFSAVDAAMLRPLPFKSPEQLVTLPSIGIPLDVGAGNTSPHFRQVDITAVREMPEYFSTVAAYASGGINLLDDERPLRLNAGVVTANFFSTLGITPLHGRTFSAAEGVPDGPDVAVLAYGLWQRQFGARDITGLRIMLGAKSYEVIGVMPERFNFPGESEVWIPLTVPSTFSTFEAFRGFLPSITFARLAPGVSKEVASAHLLARMQQWRTEIDPSLVNYYDAFLASARSSGPLQSLQQTLVGKRDTALFVLLGATGLLLLVACVNVTNLLLSQAAVRQRELAVRHVLGATRGRLVRQLLVESLSLSLAGAILGVLVAPLALRVVGMLLPTSLSSVAPATVDVRVLLFATTMALVTGVGFGLWPAIRSTRSSEGEIIKSGGGHGSTAGSAGRARRLLVTAELALTVTLLIGAALMLRSFDTLLRQNNGMRTEQVGTLEMTMSTGGARGERVRKLDELLARISVMPGIASAGIVNDLPLNPIGGIGLTIGIDGARTAGPNGPGARYLFATEGYFAAMGIQLLRGRLFTVADDSLAPPVVLISQSLASKYWPGIDPLGHTVDLGSQAMAVIGIVSDVREHKLDETPGPQMYLSLRAAPPTTVALVARGNIPERTMLAYLFNAVRGVDKSQAVYNLRMMDDVMSASVAPRRTNTLLIGAFAALALLLASFGVYAVVSHSVVRRSRELGIRAALGATGPNLMAMISREMLSVTVAGIVIGVAGAWALARSLQSLVYGVNVHDPITYALVPVALLVPTVLSTMVPARRALAVNPAEVMRAD